MMDVHIDWIFILCLFSGMVVGNLFTKCILSKTGREITKKIIVAGYTKAKDYVIKFITN